MKPVRFTLNEETVVKAAQLSASHFYARLLWFGLGVGLLTSAWFLFSGHNWTLDHALIQVGLTTSGALAFALLVIAFLRYVLYPWYARRNFRQQKALSDEVSLSWTDQNFCFDAGKSRSEMPFANLHGFRTSDDMVLLYLSDAIYHAIPVVAFGGPELHGAFLRALEAAGVRKR
jgi:hypothetical protein